jgi:BON domain
MNAMMIRRIAMTIWCATVALCVVACERQEGGKLDLELDSAGSKLERGVKEVGRELDTAWTGVKTELSEVQIEGMLRRLNGMENVEVTLTTEGDVTLTGSVATPERKELAGAIVRETRGVRSVTNTIALAAPSDSTRVDTSNY